MKPYFTDGAVTIYHGDCAVIAPQLGTFDLLCTDPPYGIGRDGQVRSRGKHGGRKAYEFGGWDSTRPAAHVLQMLLDKAPVHIVWGGNYFSDVLPVGSRWLVWDKGQRISQSDGELAWTSLDGEALRIATFNRVEIALDGAQHVTQKPLKLMTWCLSLAPGIKTVLDPFMGSGTTLRACKDLGISCVGIEREERYCEIAARRMSQQTLFATESR